MAVAAVTAAVLGAVVWALFAIFAALRPEMPAPSTVAVGGQAPAVVAERAPWWRAPLAIFSDDARANAVAEEHPFFHTKITGRVFDAESNEGIAGALVRVRPTFDRPRLGPPSGDGSVAFVSAPDGSIALKGIPPGEFDVEVSATGYANGYTSFKKFTAIEDDDGFEFPLIRSSAIEGRVIDERGKPIAGARVAQMRGEEPRLENKAVTAVTGDDGRFVLDPADARGVDLVVTHPSYEPATKLVAASDAPSRTVEITMSAGVRVNGLVRGPNGPIAGARVMPEFVRPAERLVVFTPNQSAAHGTITDSSGKFQLTAPRGGAMSLRAEAAGHQRLSLRVPPPEEDAREVEMIFELEGAAQMAGRIVNSNGDPLSKAHILVLTEGGGYAEQDTDEKGRFNLDGLPPQGPYQVRIYHHEHPPFTTEEPALRGMHEYTLEAAGRIMALLTDAGTGAPIKRYDYHLFGPVRLRNGAVSASGSLEIDQLSPGTYSLVVRADGYEPATLEGIVVSPGDTTKTHHIQLRQSASISGRVVGPSDGELIVQAFGPSGGVAAATVVGEGGTFRLENLRQGTYSLVVLGAGVRGSLEGIDVSSGAEIRDLEVPVAAVTQ